MESTEIREEDKAKILHDMILVLPEPKYLLCVSRKGCR